MPKGRAERAGGASRSHATSIDGAEHRVRLTNVMAGSVRDGKVLPRGCCGNPVPARSVGASNDGRQPAAGSARRPFSGMRAARLL